MTAVQQVTTQNCFEINDLDNIVFVTNIATFIVRTYLIQNN